MHNFFCLGQAYLLDLVPPYQQFRQERYASFDLGQGQACEQGKLTLEDLRTFAHESGEAKMTSGKREWRENIINHYI